MKITIEGDNLKNLLHWIVKEQGKAKMKDIGEVKINYRDSFIGLSVYDKEGKFITNCAC